MSYTQADYQRDIIIINGYEFNPYEISNYGNTNTKSYVVQPERNQTGSIEDIDDIGSFETPRLRINFDVMPLEVWRRMKIATKPNSFLVTYYDWEYDKRVTHRMYFATQDDIDIFQQFGAKRDWYIASKKTVDIVGTNNDIGKLTITYNSNYSVVSQLSQTIQPNELFFVKDLTAFVRAGYTITSWNTQPNGNGITYALEMAMTTTQDITLYAQWQATNARILSFYYGGMNKQALDTAENDWRASQSVNYQSAVGALPQPKMYLTENGALKEVGTLYGWWNIPYDWQAYGQDHDSYMARQIANSQAGAIKQYTSSTIYDVNGNTTIYAHWKPNIYTITYDSQGGTSVESQQVAFQNKIIARDNPTKSGYNFQGWFLDSAGTKPFNASGYMTQANNITLFAKWGV